MRPSTRAFDRNSPWPKTTTCTCAWLERGSPIREVDEEHVSYRKHPGATTSQRSHELHAAVMRVRELNDVQPFPLDAIRDHALPALCQNLLEDPDQRALWSDDRWSDQ